MIPDSLSAIYAFLLLLAPGIVWHLQRARHRPSSKESALVELSRVVLSSLLATGAAALMLLPAAWLPLYRSAERGGDNHFDSPMAAVPYVGAALATSALACALAYLVAALRWPGSAPMNGGRVWDQVFIDLHPKGAGAPFVIVELLDGTVWKGQLVGFDSTPESGPRDLAIGPPLRRRRPGATAFESKDDVWRTVVLPDAQIRSIQVSYPSRGT